MSVNPQAAVVVVDRVPPHQRRMPPENLRQPKVCVGEQEYEKTSNRHGNQNGGDHESGIWQDYAARIP